MSVGYFILHDTGILTDTGDCTEHFSIPVTSHLNFFCSKNLKEELWRPLFLNFSPHDIDNQVSALPVGTTSILKATCSWI